MQRRVAAIYFVLLLVIGGGAYAFTGLAEEPQVSIEGPAYATGDTITENGTTYTVNAIGQTTDEAGETTFAGNLTWTDESATYTASIANNTTASWPTVQWDGQALDRTTLAAGSTVRFNGSDATVQLNTTADPAALELVEQTNDTANASVESVPVDGTVTFRQDGAPVLGATVDSVTDTEAELVQADPYRVLIPNATDPTTMSFLQQINTSRLLREDPDAFNETSTNTGVERVDFRNGSDVPLSEYLPEPELKEFSEGEMLFYAGNDTEIGNITSASVPLSWTDSRTNMIDLAEGGSVTLGDTEYLVHFTNGSSVQLSENTTSTWEDYRSDQETIEKYNERMAGLWGVTILSWFAAIILLAAAYLPVKD
ncbi:hypothetical protein GJ629_04065 [Halapricum sp. CBA1109]|uniref:hypothetical protein n=1 Tax=Halapricum sp. CBA1109 TaxID=2668068 RepID=UPI0012FC5422|nr:hypothetical protein [Halapricum sp. CBA1109]MUV89173.1 hypothetical protein [Halapricum sp. CBA1109]